MRLANKTIIVTGSTTGIGKAIAKRCVHEGAQVTISGLESDLGREVTKELGESQTLLLIEDLSKSGVPEKLVDQTVARFGKLDAIVNNAGMVVSGTLHSTDLDFFRKVLEVNTLAPFQLIKAALPHLKKNKGCVLNVGSINAYAGEPGLLPYSVSKGALMTLTRNLGDTLMREDGVRINQINPGWVLTETETIRKRQHGLPDDWYRQLPSVYAPAGRILSPDEIAAAAVYWLSDECGPVSGQVVDLEQFPVIGRNPPKDSTTIPTSKP